MIYVNLNEKIIQKVSDAKLLVDNKLINEIKDGLVVFIGFYEEDNENSIDELVDKILI